MRVIMLTIVAVIVGIATPFWTGAIVARSSLFLLGRTEVCRNVPGLDHIQFCRRMEPADRYRSEFVGDLQARPVNDPVSKLRTAEPNLRTLSGHAR